jgi:hypothetical protein
VNNFNNQDINMDTRTISGLTLYYDPVEKEAADQLLAAAERSIQTITSSWLLPVPEDCRVYLMDSWPSCVFLGAPLGTQLVLGITLPLWYRDYKMRWTYAGGWSQRYGKRQVVGIKAPRLIADTPDAMGESLFVKEEDPAQKFLSIVCHELTHACSAHLVLPGWFNEGLAMVSVDYCLGKQTVLSSTIDLLDAGGNGGDPAERLNMKTQSREQIILLYVRGYWLTRYLAENYPELVKGLLGETTSSPDFEARIAGELNIAQDMFWQQIDPILVKHFGAEK